MKIGTRGPKPGTGDRPKKAIADKIADGNTGHRPLTVIDFGNSAADLEGQAMPKPAGISGKAPHYGCNNPVSLRGDCG